MMDWHLVLSSLAFAISVASLLVSRHAWTIAEEAKGKARHSLRVSVYSVEVNRKRLGIPYDHDVVEQYEANEGIFASMGVGSYKGRRCKDSDGIVQSDDAVQVFSDGTYRIVPRKEVFSVLKPVFCRVHGTCDDPSCPYAISAVVPEVHGSNPCPATNSPLGSRNLAGAILRNCPAFSISAIVHDVVPCIFCDTRPDDTPSARDKSD